MPHTPATDSSRDTQCHRQNEPNPCRQLAFLSPTTLVGHPQERISTSATLQQQPNTPSRALVSDTGASREGVARGAYDDLLGSSNCEHNSLRNSLPYPLKSSSTDVFSSLETGRVLMGQNETWDEQYIVLPVGGHPAGPGLKAQQYVPHLYVIRRLLAISNN